MKLKKITCIICPNGCSLDVDNRDGEWVVSGNLCKRGRDFGILEMTNPKRSICSTVRTKYKAFPRLPVRTDGEIPYDCIFNVMDALKDVLVEHPVHRGERIVKNVCHTGVDIIATSDMKYIIGEEF